MTNSVRKRLTCQQRHRLRRRRTRGAVERIGLDPKSYLTYERVMFILTYCRKKASSGSARAAVTLMLLESYFYTGLRAIELLGLELQDLPKFNGHPNLVRIPAEFAKRKKQRTILVNPKIVKKWDVFIERFHKQALAEMHSGNNERKAKGLATPLFWNENGRPMEYWNVYSRLQTIAKHTGIDLRAHICRHTHATQLGAKGSTGEFIQDQLGHSDPRTTRVYLKTLNPLGMQQLERLDFG